ncbi:MAG: prepilin-type N-terminal cleavage/methylation domain-containing protein [Parcubacteria group bacterium]
MSHLFKKSSKILLIKGFTLTELVVTISIVVVILTIVVSGQSTYTDHASVVNLADEIGLTLAEAQAYGVGVRELTPGSEEFSAAFGLAFNIIDEEVSTSYIFFADRNDNNRYDGGWSCPDTGECDEYLYQRVILGGSSISSLCIVRENDTEMCNVSRVDVVFVRPSTNARITFYNLGGDVSEPDNAKGAKITLSSPRGTERDVVVYNTGQISVQ